MQFVLYKDIVLFFYEPATALLLNFPCVALLYFL